MGHSFHVDTEIARVTSWVGKVPGKLRGAIDGLEWLLVALRNMRDGVYTEIGAVAW